MRRAIWIHQANQMSEATPQQYADTLLPRGITAVYIKAMDGMNWMGDFYGHPLAPRNANQFSQLVADFAGVGLGLAPWVVPRSRGSEADAHLAAAVGGGLIIDWEYQYAGFWTGTDAQAWAYHDRLRQAVNEGVWVASAPDPRQVNRDYAAGLISGLSAYQPQDYWTDFQRPWQEVMESAAVLRDLGPVEPILPYNGTPGEVVAALQWCHCQGYQAVSCWRMGSANAQQLDAFAQRVPGEETPEEPDMDCGPYKAALEKATNRLELELAKKTAAGKPAALSRPIVRQISSELFQALQS